MLEYNPVPTNNRQFDQGVQLTKKRNRNKKHKNVFAELKTLKKVNSFAPTTLAEPDLSFKEDEDSHFWRGK